MKTAIVLDAMGSDKRPQPEVEASVQCAGNHSASFWSATRRFSTAFAGCAAGDKSHVRIVPRLKLLK